MDQDKIKGPEREISASEQKVQLPGEKKENFAENKEIPLAELEMIREELRREIEFMDQDPKLKKEAEDKAKKIGSLAIDEIMAHLLETAEIKNLAFAVGVAKKMNDPYILDTFHDLLAREGYYKKFKK